MLGLVLFGTRPEAIKMAPVIEKLRNFRGEQAVFVASSGQHRSLLEQTLGTLDIAVDVNFDVMSPSQTPSDTVARVTTATGALISKIKPDWVLVQGDTATAFAGALAGHLAGVPVIHLEAGLRTHDLSAPWPEESFRQMIARVATLHLAQTPSARTNLINEGIAEAQIAVVGNTGYDVQKRVLAQLSAHFSPEDISAPFCLITVHRRENLGAPLERFCQNLLHLMRICPTLTFLWPTHPNPAIEKTIKNNIHQNDARLKITPPLDYLSFQQHLRAATLVISDSGGVQEEAASLGVPIAVVRDKTERQDIVDLGLARLVGGDGRDLEAAALAFTSRPPSQDERKAWIEIQGDGNAAENAVSAILSFFR